MAHFDEPRTQHAADERWFLNLLRDVPNTIRAALRRSGYVETFEEMGYIVDRVARVPSLYTNTSGQIVWRDGVVLNMFFLASAYLLEHERGNAVSPDKVVDAMRDILHKKYPKRNYDDMRQLYTFMPELVRTGLPQSFFVECIGVLLDEVERERNVPPQSSVDVSNNEHTRMQLRMMLAKSLSTIAYHVDTGKSKELLGRCIHFLLQSGGYVPWVVGTVPLRWVPEPHKAHMHMLLGQTGQMPVVADETVVVHDHVRRGTDAGACVFMTQGHLATLGIRMRYVSDVSDIDSKFGRTTLVVHNEQLVGALKHDGDASMVALRSVRAHNAYGDDVYPLVAGCTYRVPLALQTRARSQSLSADFPAIGVSGELDVVPLSILGVASHEEHPCDVAATAELVVKLQRSALHHAALHATNGRV